MMADYKEVFDWITSPTTDDSNYLEQLDSLLYNAKSYDEASVTDEVFRQSYIPKKMIEVNICQLITNDSEGIYKNSYQNLRLRIMSEITPK